jgi:hypothetical protein
MTSRGLNDTILASIRSDLANEFDSGMINLSPQIEERRSLLAAEHAINAALAQGSSIPDVIRAAEAECRRVGWPLPEAGDLEGEQQMVERLLLSRPGDPELQTLVAELDAALRAMAVHGLASLYSALGSLGSKAILREHGDRCGALGLDVGTTPVGEVLPLEESRDVYVSGIAA